MLAQASGISVGAPSQLPLRRRPCTAASPQRSTRLVMASADTCMPPFEFASAGRIIFGRGEAAKRLPGAVKEFGVRISAFFLSRAAGVSSDII